MGRRSDQPGTFELLARLPQQIVTLAKIEFQNAKREITRKAKRAGIGAGAIVVALFFVFFALEAFVVAAIAGIAVALPVWLAALIVAFGLLALAAAAIVGGIALLKRGAPVPDKTMHRLEGDIHALSEVKLNAEEPVPPPSRTDGVNPGQEGHLR